LNFNNMSKKLRKNWEELTKHLKRFEGNIGFTWNAADELTHS